MSKANFEAIGTAMEYFDTDSIDIYRKINIINPDGTTGETNTNSPIYSDVKCHLSFVNADNPDATSIDTKPIITGIKINCSLTVDIQNNDFIVARRLSSTGTVLETYEGVIGFPSVSQSRKSAIMEMRIDV